MRADGLNDAGGFHSNSVWQWRGVIAATEISVGEIQPDCDMADANLAVSGLADIDFLETKDLRSTGLIETNCVFQFSLPPGTSFVGGPILSSRS